MSAFLRFRLSGAGQTQPAPGRGQTQPAPMFEFEAFESLPCGCVAAAYRARQWDVSLVSIEAKGPHCLFPVNASGYVLQLGDPFEVDIAEDEV